MKQTQWYCCRLFVSFGLFEHFLLLVSCLYILLSVLWEAFLLFLGGGIWCMCFLFYVCLPLFFKKRKKGIKLGRWEGNEGGSRRSLG